MPIGVIYSPALAIPLRPNHRVRVQQVFRQPTWLEQSTITFRGKTVRTLDLLVGLAVVALTAIFIVSGLCLQSVLKHKRMTQFHHYGGGFGAIH